MNDFSFFWGAFKKHRSNWNPVTGWRIGKVNKTKFHFFLSLVFKADKRSNFYIALIFKADKRCVEKAKEAKKQPLRREAEEGEPHLGCMWIGHRCNA